ncbi:nnt1 [Acrasis kona]|uniref:Nnt1 n=1 Tax=Acrasis kona TaxID=1008807 RepID=A0AAW2ZK62_9EUKA
MTEQEESDFSFFAAEEPKDYYVPKRQDFYEEVDVEGDLYKIKIVGEHRLWGNYLWNAARCAAKHLYKNPELVKDKTVIEMGAGGGLPSLVSAHLGAKKTLLTDYPDQPLIDNLEHNVEINRHLYPNADVEVRKHLWGKLHEITEKFDVVIMSDLINNHSAHYDMLETCAHCCIPKETLIICCFTHHQPWKAKKNEKFFKIATENNFSFEKLYEEKYPVMFEKDPGEEEVRRTVHMFHMRYNGPK